MRAVSGVVAWLGVMVCLGSAGCTTETGAEGNPRAGFGAGPGGGTGGSLPAPFAGTGGTGGSAGQAGVGPAPDQELEAPMPCDVARVVSARCHGCHGATPIGGAPMPLLSQADFMAAGHSDPSRQVRELVDLRIHDPVRPMPPGKLLDDAELGMLGSWLAAGAPAGVEADRACLTVIESDPEDPEVIDPNETCYELPMHGQPVSGDTSPYSIRTGEYYQCFFYDVPWTQDVEGTRFLNAFDNEPVLHHWLLYTTSQAQADGAMVDCIGTHIGDQAQLLAGWAVGGNDVTMPDDVGFVLPKPGTRLLVEWHLYNGSGAAVPDTSAIKVCTVPKGTRPRDASITWLGTENFNGPFGMPAGVESKFSGTCNPGRAGMNGTDPIHVFAFLPHMHKLGRNMQSVVNRKNGTQEQVFDQPFDFNYQIIHDASVDLFPGDTITSTCTFFNDTNASVAFGNSSDTEMCYQFAFATPAGALHNGVFGLNGAANNCW